METKRGAMTATKEGVKGGLRFIWRGLVVIERDIETERVSEYYGEPQMQLRGSQRQLRGPRRQLKRPQWEVRGPQKQLAILQRSQEGP